MFICAKCKAIMDLPICPKCWYEYENLNDVWQLSDMPDIERGRYFETSLRDGFLPRFLSRGFSDQIAVPEDKHKLVMERLLQSFKERYGENFDEIAFKGNEEDILLTIYRK